MAWHFFKNDTWRFPLGSNPNYGGEFASSIVFSDSIPILALTFKLFKSFLPESSQYISFWYFICFYFQLFFSYKILEKFTNSSLYSFVGSIFFLTAPIFLWKLLMVPALAGHWILLFALYLGLSRKAEESKFLWIFIIFLSSLINFYFMIIILATYSLLRIINFKFTKKHLFNLTKDFFIISFLLLLTLYVTGYFEVRMVDTLALGFGRDKLNLLSIFDAHNTLNNISWSWFLPDIKLTNGEEGEGFNYLGLGQLMMLIFMFILIFQQKHKTNLASIKTNKEIKAFIFISIFFTIWALSNKISFGPYTLLEIPLNKYIYGLLSIVRPTGRLFWIVNYFLIIMSIIIIYKCLNNKNSLLIISVLLVIQLIDISAGMKKRINFFTPIDNEKLVKDEIWDSLFKEYKTLKTTYPKNYAKLFSDLSYSIEKYNLEKTNLVKLARINRKAIADAKYNLYDDFRKKDLSLDTVYVIPNSSHLRHLKYLFKNENVGFFYRDNIWIMVANEKDKMSENDKKLFSEVKLKLLNIDKTNNFYFNEKDNYYGFGWSHNFDKLGIWSEGRQSTLLFKTDQNQQGLKLKIICKPYITKKNKFLEFDVYINDSINKNIKLSESNQDIEFEILINSELIKDGEIKLDFKFKNLLSPYEVLESPDSRKLGILLKNISVNSI